MASMFGSYLEVRSKTSIAIENSLRLSRSPWIVRLTMCERNRHRRTEEMNRGLLTIRANSSETAAAGTASTVLPDIPGWDRVDINTAVEKVQLTSVFGFMLYPTRVLRNLSARHKCKAELTRAYGSLRQFGIGLR
jgi:hypothetical protein